MSGRESRFVWQDGDIQIEVPFWIDVAPNRIRGWAPFRPPFQPRPNSAAARFRAELREAVALLSPTGDDSILYSEYCSSARDLVDAENVLLYNLGTSRLGKAAIHGVSFRRQFSAPPVPPVRLAAPGALHYVEYGLSSSTYAESPGDRADVLASWSNVPWPGSSAIPRVAELWAALRSARPTVFRQAVAGSLFGVRVKISGSTLAIAPIHAMKPLLDAIVSAFHVDAGLHDPSVLRLLAAQIGSGSSRQVADLLSDPAYDVLGPRSVVASYRAGVKWNPADERCVVGAVVLQRGEGATRFSGELVALPSPLPDLG